MFIMGLPMWSSDSPAVASNRGREAMQRGDLPQAITEFRYGLKQFPDDRGLQEDLLTARTMVPAPAPDLDGWQYHVPLRSAFAVFVVLITVAAIAAAKYFTSRPRSAGWVAAIALGLALALTGVMWKVQDDAGREYETPFAVVKQPTMLREGNGESYPAVLNAPLPAGAEVTVLHRRGDWLHVRLPKGETGWIRQAE